MTKNVDLFQADRKMAERVADYMQKKVWGITLKVYLKKEVEKLENSIKGLENCRGSIVGTNVDDAIGQLRNKIAEAQEKTAKQIKEEARFEWTDADNAFFKAYKSADTQAQIYTALEKWFATYHLEVANTKLEESIVDAIRGERNATSRTIIRSGAEKFTEQKRTKNDVLKLLYGKLAERMLQAGTLKPASIPEEIREFYAPKKRTK